MFEFVHLFFQTITGDTLTSNQSTAKSAILAFKKGHSDHQESDNDGEDDELQPLLSGLVVPDPVFFCSIEPPSLAYQVQPWF